MKIQTSTIGVLEIGNVVNDTTFGERFKNGVVIDADEKSYIGDNFQMDTKTNEGYLFEANHPNYSRYFTFKQV